MLTKIETEKIKENKIYTYFSRMREIIIRYNWWIIWSWMRQCVEIPIIVKTTMDFGDVNQL